MIKIIIIEDEKNNSDLLQLMLIKIRPDWIIEGVFKSVSKSVEWLQENTAPDLIFMDIQLSDGICFSIFEQVKVTSKVIFTTAYDQYAIRAFDVNSIDYLLKPLKQSRLEKAINKFEEFHQKSNVNENDYNNIFELIRNGQSAFRTKYLIKGVTSYYSIFTEQIAYFYIENRVLFAVTGDSKEHIIDYNLEVVESQLNPNLFFRINRSIIINIAFIESFENYFSGKLSVKLTPPLKKEIHVSKVKTAEFKIWMGR